MVPRLPLISTGLHDIAGMNGEKTNQQHGRLLEQDLEQLSQFTTEYKGFFAGSTFFFGSDSEWLDYVYSEAESTIGAIGSLALYASELPKKAQRDVGREVLPAARLAINVATNVSPLRISSRATFTRFRHNNEIAQHIEAHKESYGALRPIMTRMQRKAILGVK